MNRKFLMPVAGLAFGLIAGCQKPQNGTEDEAAAIAERMKKYAVKTISYDAAKFTRSEKQVLSTLIDVAKFADEIYWLQTSSANGLRRQISKRDKSDPLRKFFEMQAGPYDRMDDDAPFMEVKEKPASLGFYPEDMSKQEFENWIAEHPEDKEAFENPYTVIRRRDDKLVAVPYHLEYRKLIVPMVNKLRYAAKMVENEEFKTSLVSTADALMTDNYSQAKSDWVGVKSSKFDFVAGPFGEGDDELLGLKKSFEASVEVVDAEAGEQITRLANHLLALENNLPYPRRYKQEEINIESCYSVVEDIFRGGTKRVAYQQLGANLPTDSKVCEVRGVKKTIWRNALQARLTEIITPIGQQLFVEDQASLVTPDAFFKYVILREITQNLGSRTVFGTETRVESALKEHSAWLKHVKADVTGLFSLKYLQRQGELEEQEIKQHFVSYLGRLFQTIRIPGDHPQKTAAIVTLNYLMDYDGFVFDGDAKKYAVDFERIDTALALLSNTVLTLEAEGDFDGASKLKNTYNFVPTHVQEALESVSDVPLVVAPMYEVIWN